MRGKLFLSSMLAMLLAISAISIGANALDADQKSVILTVEAGQTVYFDIYMSGGGSADITHAGDINKWVSHASTVSSGEWLEVKIEKYSRSIQISNEFITSGDTKAGAVFDLARTLVRRAERSVTKVHHEGNIKYDVILQYLNRLSSLCFVWVLWEDQQSS